MISTIHGVPGTIKKNTENRLIEPDISGRIETTETTTGKVKTKNQFLAIFISHAQRAPCELRCHLLTNYKLSFLRL